MSPESALVALTMSVIIFLSGLLWGKDLYKPRKIEVFQIGYVIYVEVNGKLVYKGRLSEDEESQEGELEEISNALP